MKKSKPEVNPLMVCPACEGRLRDAIDTESNLFIVWCPSPSCVAPMNLGAQARTVEEAAKALRTKYTHI